jgi:hypothetical protein
VTTLLAAFGGLGTQSVDAVSADCSSWKEKKTYPVLRDSHRARTRCAAIGSDTKVRPKLDRRLMGDAIGSYFTSTYTTYSTYWVVCDFGCSARHEIARR